MPLGLNIMDSKFYGPPCQAKALNSIGPKPHLLYTLLALDSIGPESHNIIIVDLFNNIGP